MFDGEKIKPVAPNQVKDDVLIHNKLSEIVSSSKRGLETLQQGLSLYRPNRMVEEGTSRLGESAQSRDDIVEEATQEPSEGRTSLGFQEQAEGI